ncbi:Crp/Fnr family transcriptional regulator [Listeria monocytogenes]|uniref:Crp/Fnr family transcriptional regulator n=1 Tax=Listeria monocytogenes TaxID=1639 RepID=UPI000854FE7A|nr:Crp/Fnr family transcriptional regulator [Listeria monocytogenes]EAD7603591.1 Crp/Fnr family transcriptional regulator [Listeria monocytogenes]EHP6530064.1 Crp/Fnr family transcriptional regulator [Listeria monocytogenes]OEP26939.1 DNA-binding protein [Listeria monocytogenes]HAA0615935.1 Crp/Fnr family transcriptional regulator [Listeria monocytogenes]
MDDWSTLIGELEYNTPEKGWIIREELNISEAFEIQKLEAHFILVLEGVLRMENEHQQILHYFRKNSVIYQSPYELRVQNKLRLVAETPAQIVLLHREFFLNYAANKASYSEKLMRAIMDNSASFMFELMKNDLNSEGRLAYSLQQLCQSLELEVKNEFYLLPDYVNKNKLALYSNISRKSLYKYLQNLERKGQIKMKDNQILVRISRFTNSENVDWL